MPIFNSLGPTLIFFILTRIVYHEAILVNLNHPLFSEVTEPGSSSVGAQLTHLGLQVSGWFTEVQETIAQNQRNQAQMFQSLQSELSRVHRDHQRLESLIAAQDNENQKVTQNLQRTVQKLLGQQQDTQDQLRDLDAQLRVHAQGQEDLLHRHKDLEGQVDQLSIQLGQQLEKNNQDRRLLNQDLENKIAQASDGVLKLQNDQHSVQLDSLNLLQSVVNDTKAQLSDAERSLMGLQARVNALSNTCYQVGLAGSQFTPFYYQFSLLYKLTFHPNRRNLILFSELLFPGDREPQLSQE